MQILAVKLFHHELAAGLITQEQSSISGEGADHGGGQTGVECPHAFTKRNRKDYVLIDNANSRRPNTSDETTKHTKIIAAALLLTFSASDGREGFEEAGLFARHGHDLDAGLDAVKGIDDQP